jgi:hypothetical protein
MVGKRVQFDEETWEAIQAVARQRGRTFQQLADEAFKEILQEEARAAGGQAGFCSSILGIGARRGEG